MYNASVSGSSHSSGGTGLEYRATHEFSGRGFPLTLFTENPKPEFYNPYDPGNVSSDVLRTQS